MCMLYKPLGGEKRAKKFISKYSAFRAGLHLLQCTAVSLQDGCNVGHTASNFSILISKLHKIMTTR